MASLNIGSTTASHEALVTAPDPLPSSIPDQLDVTIQGLPPASLFNLLKQAALQHPSVLRSLVYEYNRTAEFGHIRASTFWHLPYIVRNTLNTQSDMYDGLKAQYTVLNASTEVRDCIEEVEKSCPTTASIDTKCMALDTLLQIGDMLVESKGRIAKETLSDAGTIELERIMKDIVVGMTRDERRALQSWCLNKLMGFRDHAQYKKGRLFEGLNDVIGAFWMDDGGRDSEPRCRLREVDGGHTEEMAAKGLSSDSC